MAGLGLDDNGKKSEFLSTLYEKRFKHGKGGAANDNERALKQMIADSRKEERERSNIRTRVNRKDSSYWKSKPLREMTVRDWRIVREDLDIYVRGGRIANPARNWEEMNLSSTIMRSIKRMGFKTPQPIQMQAIPVGMKQRDLIGIAETGSGKTAAFILPLLSYLERQPKDRRMRTPEDGPLAVIMAPTRELAQQIHAETLKLSQESDVRSVCVVGGVSIRDQGVLLRKGCDIVVATPGRLIDCLENRYVVFNQCNYVVLDEADTMIDMGFEPQVNSVMDSMVCGQKGDTEEEVIRQEKLAATGKEYFRTTVMFTATMPASVETLAKKFMKFPAVIRIGDIDSGKNQNIQQDVIMCPEGAKRSKLLVLLKRTQRPIIVFVNARKECNTVSNFLEKNGYRVCVLHSGKMQSVRQVNMIVFIL